MLTQTVFGFEIHGIAMRTYYDKRKGGWFRAKLPFFKVVDRDEAFKQFRKVPCWYVEKGVTRPKDSPKDFEGYPCVVIRYQKLENPHKD